MKWGSACALSENRKQKEEGEKIELKDASHMWETQLTDRYEI